MAHLDARVLPFAKRASSVKHSGKVVRTITRSEIAELNKAIEPKFGKMKESELQVCMQRLDVLLGVNNRFTKIRKIKGLTILSFAS